MPRSANQKFKALALYHILLTYTDEKHPMSVTQIIHALAQQNIRAERKSIYDDIAGLRRRGLNVCYQNGVGGGWFVKDRLFQLAELKLLVDAVQASRFFTQCKSEALIEKLSSLASVHQAQQLQRQVYVHGRVKTMNESIYYNVDKIHLAIIHNRVITFRYFCYNMMKHRVYRHNGARYTVSPKGLIWHHENYYLIGFDHKREEMRHYRVDKMQDIICTGMPQLELRNTFDIATYTDKHFGMFHGRETQIRLRCEANLAGVILDRFGQDIVLVPEGETHFTVTVDVVISPQFWGWLFALGGQVKLLEPYWAVLEFRDLMRDLSLQYAQF